MNSAGLILPQYPDSPKDFDSFFINNDNSLPLIFRVFQVIIPTFAVIVICTGLCRCCLKRRHEQRLIAQASARAVDSSASVYIIPYSSSEEQPHRPPDYSVDSRHYAPPPAYNEVVVKPDLPCDPPPAYTESNDFSNDFSNDTGMDCSSND